MKVSELAELAAREAYYQALSSQIAGGKIQFLTTEGTLLVELAFPDDVAIATAEGFAYHNLAEQEVQKVGDPTRFAVLSDAGKIVLEGTVGLQNADMIIDEKNSRLFPGMKFGIEEFAYTKA